jgi:hypothetical protein
MEVPMRAALSAGLLYFAIVFAAGFALGTLRVLWLAPLAGPLAAVAIELPVMLLVSWVASDWLCRSFRVLRTGAARLAMGGFAFVLLMSAEVALGTLGFGRSIGEIVADWGTTVGLLGLAGQVAFGLVPFLQAQWVLRR